ncbi:MAG: GYD domain-containing protein [Chloroflexaceae bacterium]|nr:GYD domain-containing protein [Chloroflexaceae bacterium]
MATYIMFSKLNGEGSRVALQDRPDRIDAIDQDLEAMGVQVVAQYAVTGQYDMVSIVEAPDTDTVMSAEVALFDQTHTQTLMAVPMAEFQERVQR